MTATSRRLSATLALLAALAVTTSAAAQSIEPWATYRGNPQRTGSTDGKAGPAAPKILWAMKSEDHYIASPVPDGDRLYVSGLGAFNLGVFSCLSTEAHPKERTLWTKSTPFLKLPSVSSPSLFGG